MTGSSTADFVPYLSVGAGDAIPNFLVLFGVRLKLVLALDFREWLGGEEKINQYCHDLAVAGGRRLAWVVRGHVLESEEIIANMVRCCGALRGVWRWAEMRVLDFFFFKKKNKVNVELPISGEKIPWSEEVEETFRHQLLEEWGVYATHFWHNGKWWVRCSAQIWNDVSCSFLQDSPPPVDVCIFLLCTD
jgi:hercynylcysteine S-oxide lyase